VALAVVLIEELRSELLLGPEGTPVWWRSPPDAAYRTAGSTAIRADVSRRASAAGAALSGSAELPGQIEA
jgi:hypothetical protein